jgi:hypothetical protein
MRRTAWAPWWLAWAVLSMMAAAFAATMVALRSTTTPAGTDASAYEFSEVRARRHLVKLASEIGDRQVQQNLRARARLQRHKLYSVHCCISCEWVDAKGE